MLLELRVPDDIAEKLSAQWDDLPRWALESLAVDAYQEGILTAHEVGRLLGHASRWQTEAFLKKAGADLGYSEKDLEDDLATLRRVLPG